MGVVRFDDDGALDRAGLELLSDQRDGGLVAVAFRPALPLQVQPREIRAEFYPEICPPPLFSLCGIGAILIYGIPEFSQGGQYARKSYGIRPGANHPARQHA